MNTEQERADFEAWLRVKPCGAAHDFAWEAWQARAALQSQDKEDAERYRWLRLNGYELIGSDRGLGPEYPYGDELDAAIDHARRIDKETL